MDCFCGLPDPERGTDNAIGSITLKRADHPMIWVIWFPVPHSPILLTSALWSTEKIFWVRSEWWRQDGVIGFEGGQAWWYWQQRSEENEVADSFPNYQFLPWGEVRRHQSSSLDSADSGNGSDMSPSKYSLFRNDVRSSKVAFSSVNHMGGGLAKAAMIELNQEQWLEKMAWAVQPQLHHAVDHVSMVAHGIRKLEDLMQTPLCERTSREAILSYSNRLRSSKG